MSWIMYAIKCTEADSNQNPYYRDHNGDVVLFETKEDAEELAEKLDDEGAEMGEPACSLAVAVRLTELSDTELAAEVLK